MIEDTIQLGEIMVSKTGSVDPSRHADEVFDLYSIPAFDRGRPEIAEGSSIGSSKQVVKAGDVLLSRIVPHIRRAWVVARSSGRRIIASGEWIVFRSPGVYPEYLRHVLTGDSFHREFMRTVAGVGGSLLRARPTQVAQIPISLPSVAEQKRIAAILDATEALREKRLQTMEASKTFVQSTYRELFGDPLRNDRQWPTRKLSTVGVLDRGVSKHRPRNAPELLGGLHPLIQTGDIANCDGYVRTYGATYSDLGLRQSKLWPAGTLCITIAANIGRVGILTFDACFPDSVVGFLADDEATVEYVRVWFSFLQKSLEDYAPESAQKNINLTVLRNLPIPMPPRRLLEDFHRRIAALDKSRAVQTKSGAQLDKLLASLQHRAFRGEL